MSELYPFEPASELLEGAFGGDTVEIRSELDLDGEPLVSLVGIWEDIPHDGERYEGSSHVLTCQESQSEGVRKGDMGIYDGNEYMVTHVTGDDTGMAIIHFARDRIEQILVDDDDPLSGIS